MGYKNLSLLILAFAVVCVQAELERTLDLVTTNITQMASNGMEELIHCFMETNIMKIVSDLASIAWKVLCKFSSSQLVKAAVTSFECLMEAEEKMIESFIQLTFYIICMIISMIPGNVLTDIPGLPEMLSDMGIGDLISDVMGGMGAIGEGLGGVIGGEADAAAGIAGGLNGTVGAGVDAAASGGMDLGLGGSIGLGGGVGLGGRI